MAFFNRCRFVSRNNLLFIKVYSQEKFTARSFFRNLVGRCDVNLEKFPSKLCGISHSVNVQPACFKSKKSRRIETRTEELSDDSDEESEDHVVGKGAEIKKYVVGSMRLDLLLKTGLGMARNKVEEAFYESKIRINSKKTLKKSIHVQVGDEVDLIKGQAPGDANYITVGRIEILNAKPRDDDSIEVKMRRSKQLIIENYPDGDPWRQSETNQL